MSFQVMKGNCRFLVTITDKLVKAILIRNYIKYSSYKIDVILFIKIKTTCYLTRTVISFLRKLSLNGVFTCFDHKSIKERYCKNCSSFQPRCSHFAITMLARNEAAYLECFDISMQTGFSLN